MSEIVTLAQETSNAVRAHGFPVLEAGNISFPNGRYIVKFTARGNRSSFDLTHRIEGARLISRLLEEGKALYVCAVSSPIASYRRTHAAKTPKQTIEWDESDLGEPPLFTPMIVSAIRERLRLSEQGDGVHVIWNDRVVEIETGSKLAVGHVVGLRSSILSLLWFNRDESLGDGEFHVDAETEHGFRFRVSLHPQLHDFLRYPSKDGARNHIMTHIVTACLALLQRGFGEDTGGRGWRSHRNLRAFAESLEGKSLPHWSDDQFRPEEVATKLHPHVLPKVPEEDES